MKQLYLISLLSAVFLYGCKSEFGKFNDDALAFANNDKKIDQKEYELLVDQIQQANEKGFQNLKSTDGKIDNDKVITYLLKYYSAKKMPLTSSEIWQPENAITKDDKFNINVFLENSASMDGYVKGVTEFETSIYNLLGDFKISGLCDSLNLSYINKSIPYEKKNALALDIQDFIEKLEPSTFRQRGGDRSTSDLKNILNTVLQNVNENNAAVLISDFVFSPGSKNNAQEYLNNQGVGIKIDFAEKLKTFDLSVVIIQLQSYFNGSYYDKTDKPISLTCKRPYYIWIIGSTKHISEILTNKMLDNIKGGYQNRLVIQPLEENANKPIFKILSRPRIGEFELESLAQGIITGATASKENKTKGIFGFSLAVNFSKSVQEPIFFLDTANYFLSDKGYSLKSEIIGDKNEPALSGFSHILKLQTNDLKDKTLTIDVLGKVPSWVYSSTSLDDSRISNDDSEKQKTFGFKYLVEGVCDAFYPKSNSNILSSISVTIKK